MLTEHNDVFRPRHLNFVWTTEDETKPERVITSRENTNPSSCPSPTSESFKKIADPSFS